MDVHKSLNMRERDDPQSAVESRLFKCLTSAE